MYVQYHLFFYKLFITVPFTSSTFIKVQLKGLFRSQSGAACVWPEKKLCQIQGENLTWEAFFSIFIISSYCLILFISAGQ